MSKKVILSLFLAVIMVFSAVMPAFAATQSKSVQTGTAVSASADDESVGDRIVASIRDFFARIKALFVRIFPCLKDSSVKMYPTEDIRKTYGEAVGGIKNYTDYGFDEVEAAPLANVFFDDIESLDALSEENASLSDASGAELVTGRFGLRKALSLTSPDTYLTLPDMGQQDVLTISMWVNIHDLQTRANTDEPRVSTLLDTAAGAGRVTLKFVHTGTPSYVNEAGEAVMGTNSTKLVFSVQGNSGSQYNESSVCSNNTQFFNFEYDLWEDFVGYHDDWVVHPEGHCWFHIGVVYEPDKGDVTFYHCGKFDSIKHFDSAVKPMLNGIRIGAGYAENEYFDGMVDDIRLYGDALTQEDMDILADFERDMWVNRTISDWQESDTVLYVNGETGSNLNPGTADAPFATVKKGVESITAPGTRLVVAPGLYRETSINLNANGTETQPVIIEAERPARP